jgi:uncharacterized membrane protein
MKMTTAYAITWIATGLSISMAIVISKNAGSLWALLIPALISFHSDDKDN